MKKLWLMLMIVLLLFAAIPGMSRAAGTCLDWKGVWKFVYDNTTKPTICFDNTTLDNPTVTLCDNDSLPNCQCVDNVTSKRLCVDNVTFQQCDNDSLPNCVCFDNPVFKNPSIAPGMYAVTITSAQQNFTLGQIQLECYATGTRQIDSKPITIALPTTATIDKFASTLRNVIVNSTYIVYEGNVANLALDNATIDNATLSFALIPSDNFTGTSFKASRLYDFTGLVSGTKGTDNMTGQCDLTILPRALTRLRAAVWPLKVFIIRAAPSSTTSFTTPITIDWGTNAIREITRVRVNPKVIVGLMIVRPMLLQSGSYDVSVTYGDNGTACGSINVR